MSGQQPEFCQPGVELDAPVTEVRKQELLQELLRTLAEQGYNFISVTPATHERVLARCDGLAKNTRDIFGWNLPFELKVLPPLVFNLLVEADLLTDSNGYFSSSLRVASLGSDLFLHSRFPTTDANSVFFGPDTYRFARYIKHSMQGPAWQALTEKKSAQQQPVRILDVGCGSGAGGISAIRALPKHLPFQLHLNDVNPIALDYAAVCAAVADIPASLLPGDFFALRDSEFDLIVSNPPYIVDSGGRLYRDGGGQLGLEFSLRVVKHALGLLAPGGQLILYTGVALTSDDINPLLSGLTPWLAGGHFHWVYEELDPDIFGEELDQPGYEKAHRIAAVGLTVTRNNEY